MILEVDDLSDNNASITYVGGGGICYLITKES